MKKPYLAYGPFTPLVHRANGFGAPENSLMAIEAALASGFDCIETDVQTTSDGVAVLMHDRDTRRLSGSPGMVKDMSYADLQAEGWPPGGEVPRLLDLLTRHKSLRLNLDLKDRGSATSVPEVIHRAAATDRVCVTSFSDRRLAVARRLLPASVCTGMGVGAASTFCVAALAAPRGFPAVRLVRADVLQIPFTARAATCYRRIVEFAHGREVAVHAWTVNTRSGMEAALEAGFDGIVTDHPFELKELLMERGLWGRG